MTLQEHIDEIRDGLNNGLFQNEASVREYIVLRVLHELGWPRYNPQVIIPEHSVGGGQVDYALCHPPSEPSVFIEVKRVGQIEGAERQLFEYAFHTGVPIAILTDGREWHFFYPTGEGDYRERRVYQLDLIETDIEEIAERLNRYLNYYLIRNHRATQAIRDDYQVNSQRRQIEEVWSQLSEHQRRPIEEAWSELLEQESRLVGQMAREVEHQWDRPTDEQVLDFLRSRETIDPPQPRPPLVIMPDGEQVLDSLRDQETIDPPQPPLVVTINNEEPIRHRKAVDTFVEAIEKIGGEIGMERMKEAFPRLVSDSEFPHGCRAVQGGYYVNTNSATKVKKRHLERIAEQFDISLEVEIFPTVSN